MPLRYTFATNLCGFLAVARRVEHLQVASVQRRAAVLQLHDVIHIDPAIGAPALLTAPAALSDDIGHQVTPLG